MAQTKPASILNPRGKPAGKTHCASDVLYLALTSVFLFFCGLVVFIPLLYVVSASFSSPTAIGNGKVFLLPVDFSLKGYAAVVTSARVWLGFRNSVVYTVLGTSVNIVMTMLAAYPLSRRDLKARGFIMKLFTFTMLFSGGLIPNYLLINRLGMLNTIWAMVFPGAISVYNMIVARTYISNSIPWELFESATLDGCTDDRYLLSIVVPLSKPILAVLILWYAVGHWNAYFNAMIYLKDKALSPLQIVLREFLIVEDMTEANISENIEAYMDSLYMKNLYQYSLIIVSAVPVMLLYPVIQRYFVQGIMLGSIKG